MRVSNFLKKYLITIHRIPETQLETTAGPTSFNDALTILENQPCTVIISAQKRLLSPFGSDWVLFKNDKEGQRKPSGRIEEEQESLSSGQERDTSFQKPFAATSWNDDLMGRADI